MSTSQQVLLIVCTYVLMLVDRSTAYICSSTYPSVPNRLQWLGLFCRRVGYLSLGDALNVMHNHLEVHIYLGGATMIVLIALRSYLID